MGQSIVFAFTICLKNIYKNSCTYIATLWFQPLHLLMLSISHLMLIINSTVNYIIYFGSGWKLRQTGMYFIKLIDYFENKNSIFNFLFRKKCTKKSNAAVGTPPIEQNWSTCCYGKLASISIKKLYQNRHH